jgi:hypothetical protein
MDGVDFTLKRSRAIQHGRVGEQVDDHVAADGENAGERKEAIEEELVAAQKRRGVIVIQSGPFHCRLCMA